MRLGRRTFLAGWFKRYDRCRTCGVSWHREEGFELGTITINTIVTFGSLSASIVDADTDYFTT